MGRLRERRDQLSSEASDAQPLDTKAIEAMARKKEITINVRVIVCHLEGATLLTGKYFKLDD